MLPKNYEWLAQEGAPKMLVEALKLYGTTETAGAADNPEILAWAKELGLKDYIHDSIAWCGLFAAIVAKRAGKEVVKNPLWAANWSTFGDAAHDAMLGDILVFKREGGNHVAIYVGEDEIAYHVIGGNQSDKVCITRIQKSRCWAIRRAKFSTAQPANVRAIVLSGTGAISTNEA